MNNIYNFAELKYSVPFLNSPFACC